MSDEKESSWELKQDYVSPYALFLTTGPCCRNCGTFFFFFSTGTAYPEIIHRSINGFLYFHLFNKYILFDHYVPKFVVSTTY